jgi:serine/threonine-protein kinase
MSDVTSRLADALDDRYGIERHLGEGGMATVYLAQDLKHDRQVALKVLRPELAAVIGAERFLQEIKVTANLQHPHILPLHDSGEAGSFLYYVMPYVEGDTLRDKLARERQLDIDEAVTLTRSVASALDYAHRQGVIHRDIKPENVLIHDGQPLVADFGIALAVSHASGQRLTETGLSIGTPHYMSPEQAMGDRELDARSDVYSLGAMLYEMLTGDPPYTGTSAQAIVAKVITEKAPPVTAARETVPPHVAAAVAKALQKMPADRFRSAADFAAALGNPAFATAAAAHVASPTHAAARPSGRTALAGWAAAGVLAVALGTVLLLRPDATSPAGPTVLTLDPGIDSLSRLARVRVARDGRTFAIERREGNGSPLYVRAADEPDFRPLAGTEGARWATFDPTGEWIAYHSGDGNLMKVALRGGRPITLFTDDAVRSFEPHWGDDGTIVFTGPDGMFRVPGSGGVPQRLLETGMGGPHILPDGSGVLYYTFGSGGRNVELLDLRTDSTRLLIEQAEDPRYLASGHILFAHPSGGLYVVPFDRKSGTVTGERTPVLDDVDGSNYEISATGTLVFRSGMAGGAGGLSQRELVRVRLNGTVDTLRLAPRPLSDTRISPDGSRLVYLDNDDDQLYLYDFELGGPTQLTFEGENDTPVWSPDGARIVFASRREDGEDFDLYVKAVDGGDSAALLLKRPGVQFAENWTADGTITFYERTSPGAADLWTMPADGSGEPRPFLVTEWGEVRLAVSPDGQWAAYQSNETGTAEVYVRAFPGGTGQRRVSQGGGFAPRWSSDGGTIFYTRYQGDVDTIFGARVRLEPSFLVTATDVAYTAPTLGRFDVHPDGTHLIAEVFRVQPQAAADSSAVRRQIVVILDWFEELKRAMGER